MAGIYIHIPFCKQACTYCDFHFSTDVKRAASVVAAMLGELDLRKNYLTETIESIYLGGGSPSLLSLPDLEKFFNSIHSLYAVAADAETTIEVNPDDVSTEKLNGWKTFGINRLSMGVQSFDDTILKWMNRAHSAGQAKVSIEAALAAGFEDLSIDLIYGASGSSDRIWQRDLKTAMDYEIPHLSCYALTVEPRTVLGWRVKKGIEVNIDEGMQRGQYEFLMGCAARFGYEQYEISSFAKPGYESQHNSNYWKRRPYIGIGPSAHSFDGKSRQWNISNNGLYVQNIASGGSYFEHEVLTTAEQFNEYILLGLRTSMGISKGFIKEQWGALWVEHVLKQLALYQTPYHVTHKADQIVLTPEGRLFADAIASQLLYV